MNCKFLLYQFVIWLFIHELFVPDIHAQSKAVDPFSVERISATKWRIKIIDDQYQIDQVNVPTVHSKISLQGYDTYIDIGQPQLPFKKLIFGIPPDGELRYKIINQNDEVQQIELLPYMSGLDSSLSNPSLTRNDVFLNRKTKSSSQSYINLSRKEWIGDLCTQSIQIFPALYDSENKLLHRLKNLILEIEISGNASKQIARSKGIDIWNNRFHSQIINISDAINWIAQKQNLSTESWYNPKQPYIKIHINKKGIVRISKTSFDTLGINLSGIDPQTFQLFNRGVEVPIYIAGEADQTFDAGDYIEFTCDMNHGERGEYFDLWTNENDYWLTWGAHLGKRYSDESIAVSNQAALASTIRAVHLEEDHIYHSGDNDDEGDISEYLPGETWIWKYLFKKDSLLIPFHLVGVEQTNADAKLTIRVKGSSRDNKRIRISVNSTQVDQFDINPNELITKDISFSQSLLKEGENTLLFYNVSIVDCPPTDPTCTIERLYIDWAEVKYHNTFKVDSDLIAFMDTVLTNKFKATINGFSSNEVVGYNISNGTRLIGLTPIKIGTTYQFDGAFQSRQDYIFASTQNLVQPVRIEKDISSDWSNSSNGADYLIITHSYFIQQAERLTQYRATKDGYRTAVIDVEDLFDEFNYGIKHPVAIRNFLRHAYNNWTAPKPKFVTILGDASWDTKFLQTNAKKIDYVPAWGNPVEDNYFVAFNDSDDIVPKMVVGRIPCESAQAADDVIDKIISYENLPLQHWQKNVMMVNGGKYFWEHPMFRLHSERMIDTYLNPYCLDVTRVYRSTESIISYAELDSIISFVNRGTLMFHFTGHGGPRIIDVGIDRPDIFSTKDHYPFFITLSCNTSHFGEPFETGLNELFIMAKNNGSICSFGTSGRGTVNYDNDISESMFYTLTRDSLRTFGELTTSARTSLALMYPGNNQIVRNTVNQYTLLGDPATHIPLPRGTELSITASDISTEPEIITDNSTAMIKVRIYNDGLCFGDSVSVIFTHEYNTAVVEEVKKRIPAFSVAMDIEAQMNFRGYVGLNQIRVTIDPGNEITEKNKKNNIASIQLIVIPESVHPIFPMDNSVIHTTKSGEAFIEFIVSNPSVLKVDRKGEIIDDSQVEIQISDASSFQNLITTITKTPDKTFTTLLSSVKYSENQTFWWRARLYSSSESKGWSNPRSFTIMKGTDEEWYQNTYDQFRTDLLTDCSAFNNGAVKNSVSKLMLEVVSGGSRNVELGNFANIKLNSRDVAPNRRGFNVAIVNRINGALIDTAVFDTYWSNVFADDMADYLDRVDSTKFVIIAVKDDANGYPPVLPNGTNITTKLNSRLREFGARLIDSIKFRGSYALMGVRNNPQYSSEGVDSLSVVVMKDTLQVNSTVGKIVSTLIGPASAWHLFSRKDSVKNPQSSIEYSLWGSKNDRDSLLLSVPKGNAPVDMSMLSANSFPSIKIQATLNDSSGILSPELDWWKVSFDSFHPELGINCQSVFNEQDSVLEGALLKVYIQIYNYGRIEAKNITVVLRNSTHKSQVPEEKKLLIQNIKPKNYEEVIFEVPTAGYRGLASYEIMVDPGDSLIEYYKENNFFTKSYYVLGDKEKPSLDVLFDGSIIVNNDYVSPKPEITIRLTDNSPLSIIDTSSVQLYLDGYRIFLINNPLLKYSTTQSGKEKLHIQFYPTLSNGIHSLAVNGRDPSGNPTDTTQVRFYVSSNNKVDQIFPFPNPTNGPVSFTFRCIGFDAPEKGKIKIYTVAGRLIKEIQIAPQILRIGFNKIDWNGLDEEGDAIANGVYFYKLILERGGSEETFIDKIAIVK